MILKFWKNTFSYYQIKNDLFFYVYLIYLFLLFEIIFKRII